MSFLRCKGPSFTDIQKSCKIIHLHLCAVEGKCQEKSNPYVLPLRVTSGIKSQDFQVVFCRDSSVGIALGYGLDDRSSRVRLPVGAGNFYLHYRLQKGCGAHPASYPMGTRGSFPGGKAAGV
jgi:hypothetical protein